MNLWEIFRFSFAALRDRKVRSGLTMLMVVIGAALIVSLNGMNAGMNVFISEQFKYLAPDLLFVTPAPLVQTGATQTNPMRLDDGTVRNLQSISEVREVIPVIQRTATLKVRGYSMEVLVMGMDLTKGEYVAPNMELEEGSIVMPYDAVGALVGHEVKHPPGRTAPLLRLGQVFSLEHIPIESGGLQQVEKRSFVVRGVLKDLGVATGGAQMMNRAVMISLPAANSFFEAGGEYDMIFVVTAAPELNERVVGEIREIYGEDIGVTSPKAIVETIQGFIAGFAVFFLGVAAVSLIVAAVGVVTTIYTSVIERTREIGVLKALGFMNRTVMALFLSEALLIGMVGGSVGIGLGMSLGFLLLKRLGGFAPVDITPVYLPTDLLFVWVFTVVISVIAGLHPAWRAAKLPPVVALRKE